MQWSLFVLILMGQCSFFTCHLYEYHFIQDNKTWDEARSYCRRNYTDLATVSDMRDMKRLTNSSQTTNAWIGLRSIDEKMIKEWHWSLPGEKYNHTECDPEWSPNQPDNGGGANPENCCEMIWYSKKWNDGLCSKILKFICYNETGPQKYVVIDKPKLNWLQAQSYCRKHHTDLISGITHINEFKDQYGSSHLWIGLFREIWSWSDGKNFSFRHWDPDSFKDVFSKTCAMTTMPNGKWSSNDCGKKQPFYCYDDKVILIKENKTWDEALDYCRENHHDLVSITDSHQQRWVQERAKMADTEFVWLGMRYTCTLDLWFWVIDRLVCYHNWATDEMAECGMAAVMKRDGKWYKKADNEKFNFICAI